ncbi:MAG: TonB-dependent receptor [Caulobacteraceae bacterium]
MKRFPGASPIALAAALAGSALPVLAHAQATGASYASRKVALNIASGDLRDGISAFSRASGLQIVADPALVAGRRTGGVHGEYTVSQGLTQLLKGAGLGFSLNNAVAVIKATPPERDPPRPTRVSISPPVTGIEQASGDAPAQVSEVVVTGYRQSLQKAQDLKRMAVGSEDDILAQDIAAFPDLNLAESLQRIPGIAITRDAGEGRQITLRGLGPDFTRTDLNGMEVLGNTASGMDNRGNVSRTRSFDFSLFASELFDKVSVQKSYAAEQDEGGIAGTVQLYTAKPFDYPGAEFVLSAKGQTNTNTSGVTPRVVALASDRWGPFGALVSVAYSEIKSNEYGYRNWGWGQVQYNPANVGPGISPATAAQLEATGPGQLYAPQAESPSSWYTDRKRLGVTAALQYQPDSHLHVGLDLLYGRLTNNRDDYAISAGGTNALTGNVSGTQVIQSAVVDGNSLVAGSYTGVDLRSEHNIQDDSTDFYQAVLNSAWTPNDQLTVSLLGGYQRSNYEQPFFDKVFLEAQNQAFSFDDRPTVPVNTYGFNVNDPNAWQLMRLDTQANTIDSQYVNGKGDIAYAFNTTSTLKVGGEYKDFTNSGAQYNNKVFYNAPTLTQLPNSLKSSVPVDTLFPYIVGNVNQTYAYIGQSLTMPASDLSPGSDYQVEEKTVAAYIQYDLDTHLFGYRTRANVGVRYYTTDTTSSGELNTGTTLSPVSIKNNDRGWLPAANLAVNVTDDFILRASVNRNVNRAPLSDLAAAGTLTTAPFGGSISVGNPYLKPYKATSVEGSAEYYFDHNGYASLGVFFKDMDSFITTETTVEPYSATGYPVSFLLPGQDGTVPYNFSRPINGPGASIKGIEAAFQHDFNFLPAPFDHLGMVTNVTYADGDQDVLINGQTFNLPLINLSKYSANATLYYETDRWGVRISEAYRSQYLDSAGSSGNVGEGVEASNNVDFSAHYNVSKHLKLVVEGINITNQPIVQFLDIHAHRPEVYTNSGRTFTFGATYAF